MSNNSKTAETKTIFHSNPLVSRLGKIDERAVDEKSAAYGRIAAKVAMFLLWTVAGILIYLLLDSRIFSAQTASVSFSYYGVKFSASQTQIGFFAGAAIIAIICQLLAAFVSVTTPVTGSIYSICQGFIISFLIFTVLHGKEYLGLLALIITIVVVMTMALLYTKGIIRATRKFNMVLFTLFGSMIGISIIIFIAYLIPVTRPFVATVMGNFWISLGLTLLSIIIATLFLISDFSMIENVVENKLPAKYEWTAAFGLAFTILWIYVKILDLLIQLFGNRD
jgi:uncharacterized YccA/Bax inhibitor family protein